jgi:hypothetical protein
MFKRITEWWQRYKTRFARGDFVCGTIRSKIERNKIMSRTIERLGLNRKKEKQ